jgi:hypothetical protein
MMGVRKLDFAPELLVHMLKPGPPRAFVVESGALPDDAEYIRAEVGGPGGYHYVSLLVHSATWDGPEDAAGLHVPTLDPPVLRLAS